MRKALLLGVLGALCIAGTAYAAVTVTNIYVMHATITPAKSGTKAKPRPIGGHLDFAVTTNPKGYRPNIVKTVDIRIQGIQENTNDFPVCGTARLNDPTEGPTTCPAGSKVGTGFFIADISPAGNQKTIVLTCRVEVTIYDAGNHDLSYYGYKGPQVPGQPAPCPLTHNEAWNATLTKTPRGLVQTATIPQDLRHPVVGTTSFDASAIKASFNISKLTTAIKKKGKKGKKSTKTTVGLFESILCPPNHHRQVAVKFTQENGRARTVTRGVTCT